MGVTRLLLLPADPAGRQDVPAGDFAVVRELPDLLERVRLPGGGPFWVAISPRVPEPLAVVEQIRQADPRAAILLLADDSAAPPWPDAPSRPPSPDADRLAAVTELIASIAHEVGSPMTAILGYAELLAASSAEEKNRKRARIIVEQVHRVSDLIETLMHLARSEDRPPVVLDLTGLLDHALELCRDRLVRRHVQLERRDRGAPRVLGDPDRLQQVLLTALLHGAEAMPGGGTLRVAAIQTGAGAEVRIDQAAEQPAASSGVGVGLLVARSIIEEHGGTLRLPDPADPEASIRICLPHVAETADEPA